LYIVNADKNKIVWQFDYHSEESNIIPSYKQWFTRGPDELKPVYNLKYILITVSKGGVALIRVSDKKVVWYAYAGKNPHSAEILPDGNIVVASSTDSKLTVFHVDTTEGPGTGYKKEVDLPFAHNVVWDKKRKLLWSAGRNRLYSFRYNFDCKEPDLIPKDTFMLPGNTAHDLFPLYNKDSLYFTNASGVYYIDLKTANPKEHLIQISQVPTKFQENVKSVSSGPKGWPTIIQYPTNSNYSNKMIDLKGNTVFIFPGWTIYKARWFVPNLFSYPENDEMKTCN